MIEAIAHLINRDYGLIGDDFVNLDFIPRGTDTGPIVPALKRVFGAFKRPLLVFSSLIFSIFFFFLFLNSTVGG